MKGKGDETAPGEGHNAEPKTSHKTGDGRGTGRPAGRRGTRPMKDRRRDVRVVEENKVVVSLMTGEVRPGLQTVFHSLTRDLSVGGLRVMTSAPLEPGLRVRVELTLGRSRRMIRAVAEVRWVRDLYGSQVFEAGLEFVELQPDDEFALMDHIYRGKDGNPD